MQSLHIPMVYIVEVICDSQNFTFDTNQNQLKYFEMFDEKYKRIKQVLKNKILGRNIEYESVNRHLHILRLTKAHYIHFCVLYVKKDNIIIFSRLTFIPEPFS